MQVKSITGITEQFMTIPASAGEAVTICLYWGAWEDPGRFGWLVGREYPPIRHARVRHSKVKSVS